MYYYHGFFPFWCQKVLPLVYDESLSYYELLCKVVHYLGELGKKLDGMDKELADVVARLEELEKHGFTDEQLREVLDEMVASGEFDFLVDMINSKMSLWDIVGLKPFAQVLPEQCGVTPSGYTVQSMAIGEIDNVKICFVGYVHKTGNDDDGSLVVTYNFSTGEVIDYATGTVAHMNSVGFNPNDNNFYVTPGGDFNKIIVYNKNCNIVKYITNDVSDPMKAGGIAFNKTTGKCYIAWYSDDGSNATIKLNEIDHIENYTILNSTDYDKTNTWDRVEIDAVGRQDIYCDDMYIYMPTYWHRDGTLNWGYYNKQDVFSISTLEYVQTQYIDMNYEINGGEYFEGKYYLIVNTITSGLICTASVVRNNAPNSAYEKISNMHAFTFNYGPVIIYANADKNNFFVDGKTVNTGFNRLRMLNVALYPFTRSEGIEVRLAGDFTQDGLIESFSVRNCLPELSLVGVQETVLPKLTFTQCNKLRFNNVTFKTFTSDYCLYIVRCKPCFLQNVKFENGDLTHTISRVLDIDNSMVIVTGKDENNVDYTIGFDGTTPTAYVRTRDGAIAIGKFHREYGVTGSGTYITMSEFTFAGETNVNSHIIGCMTNAGLTIEGTIAFSADKSANTVIAGLPTDNHQNLSSMVAERSDYSYFNGVNGDGENVRFRYVYSTKKIELLDNVTSGDTVYVNAVICVNNVVV